mmetsp:Transcript_28860/g.40568  ORF Transcript_28860/g.40568 Transcript_28860/m.40568 type:complete len:90 (-) Transcript_28860:185-454(-)
MAKHKMLSTLPPRFAVNVPQGIHICRVANLEFHLAKVHRNKAPKGDNNADNHTSRYHLVVSSRRNTKSAKIKHNMSIPRRKKGTVLPLM